MFFGGIFIKFKHFIFIILLINILSINVYSQEKNSKDIIKVGVYNSEPYYSIDCDGNVSGYYDDYLKLLQKKYKFNYEYVNYSFDEGIKALEDGRIDIMFGVSITNERAKKIIFNNNYIAIEKYAVLTNKDMDYKSLEDLDGMKIGVVKGMSASEKILDLFSTMGINLKPIYSATWEGMDKLLIEGKVDAIIHDQHYKKNEYKTLYKISGDQVYIGANKNNSDILEHMDKVIEEYNKDKNNPLSKLSVKYLSEDYDRILLQKIVLLSISTVSILLIAIFYIVPKMKKNNVKNKIKINMDNNKYLLQYQPIYNPKNKDIVGFEGLLRLLDENNKLIPPYKFIPEIEKNDMLFDITIWILRKVIHDYNEIRNYKCVKDKEFYISLNLSLHEIENDNFIQLATEILSKSNLGSNKICLEIIERVKMKDLDKIVKNIDILKKAGFKIAIDDFGTEYSNLDILQKLDVDIIKVDKYFVDGIGKDIIKDETLVFISRIANAKNKAVILEGVEEEYQDARIKKMEKNKIYVQGYYYNKPMYINDIKLL